MKNLIRKFTNHASTTGNIHESETPIPEARIQAPAGWLIAAFSLLAPAMSRADMSIWAEESGGNTTFYFSGSFAASTLDAQDTTDPPSTDAFFGEGLAYVDDNGIAEADMGIGTKNGATLFIQRYSDNRAINPPGTEAALEAIAPENGDNLILASYSSGDVFTLDFELSDLDFLLPANYVPGTTIQGNSTWVGKSLADLGFSNTNRVDVIIKGPLQEKIIFFSKTAGPDNSARRAALKRKLRKLNKKLKSAKRRKQVAKIKRFKKQIKKLKRQIRAL